MDNMYLKTLLDERKKLDKSVLFKEIVTSIRKKRSQYSEYCNISKDDVRFFQGYVLACDDIIGTGEKIKIIDNILNKIAKKTPKLES